MTIESASPSSHPRYRRWSGARTPGRILLIRLHAIGDVAVTLPVVEGLRACYPEARIDFLTARDAGSLLESLSSVNNVYTVPNRPARIERVLIAYRLGRLFRRLGYDVVLDLQSNWFTRLIRLGLTPDAWGEFDRLKHEPAGHRVLEALRRAGFSDVHPVYRVRLKNECTVDPISLLLRNGWTRTVPLIVLNPAGGWETRNWPLQNYVELVRVWAMKEEVRFLMLGTERMSEKAGHIERAAPEIVINLCGKTTLPSALSMLQVASLMISEDSGLMHLAASAGLPVIALLGSSAVWRSAPVGHPVQTFDSRDLECGECMRPTCRYRDVHCLSRYDPLTILRLAMDLLHRGTVPAANQ